MPSLLAFDTATERIVVGVQRGSRLWTRDGEGGSRASSTLIPTILSLLADAGMTLADVDAIAFGRGPGAFTGLRIAASVAQGLALGAGKGVVPVDTLLVVAEDARDAGDQSPCRIWAVIDARMDEIYAAEYAHDAGRWSTVTAPFLVDADALTARWADAPPSIVAGNALSVFGDRLLAPGARRIADARPTAEALLRVAAQALADDGAVDAALALPLYVRDKVALTTAERASLAAAKAMSTCASPLARKCCIRSAGSAAGRRVHP